MHITALGYVTNAVLSQDSVFEDAKNSVQDNLGNNLFEI